MKIAHTTATNQDDCVAFKSGANLVTVTEITCTGSHRLSVGSLGGSTGTDSVTNVLADGATMVDLTKAVGIKLYEGTSGHAATRPSAERARCTIATTRSRSRAATTTRAALRRVRAQSTACKFHGAQRHHGVRRKRRLRLRQRILHRARYDVATLVGRCSAQRRGTLFYNIANTGDHRSRL